QCSFSPPPPVRCPPADPVPHPASANAAPSGWLVRPTPGRSTVGFRMPRPPLRAYARPAPRTVGERTCSGENPVVFGSTQPAAGAARLESAGANPISAVGVWQQSLQAAFGNGPASSKLWRHQKGPCYILLPP